MIASGILLVLTTTITVAWLYVELTDVLGTADRGRSARDDDGNPDV